MNRLEKLKYLNELILNNCAIDEIKLPNQAETAKQIIISHLSNLTHLNRVFINRDERRGAEIDYFDQKLDFINEHRQYKKLIEKYVITKGLCIRRNLLQVIFEFGGKLKIFIRRLFPLEITNDIQINLFVIIDEKHKELMSNDYQNINFYLGNSLFKSI
ncbi:unnamed protein product [Rotaria sp. Silwood1]|nr:unnamed protein product [Rotaria sp. Silwood1]